MEEACCFFGHSDAPEGLKSKLYTALTELIEIHGVRHFYIGTHGNFDAMVYEILCELRRHRPEIEISVVLAYMPQRENCYGLDSIFPEGLETVPRRLCILYRGRWMLEHSAFVIAYVKRPFGGAAKFVALAKKQRKTVISLSDEEEKTTPSLWST